MGRERAFRHFICYIGSWYYSNFDRDDSQRYIALKESWPPQSASNPRPAWLSTQGVFAVQGGQNSSPKPHLHV